MKSVLVIEDDSDMADSLSSLLELYDVDVIGRAQNGKEGFELFQKLHPDFPAARNPDDDGGLYQYGNRAYRCLRAAAQNARHAENGI